MQNELIKLPAATTYLVGGAVRDALMGLPVGDLDYVVVGATPQQMHLAGFKSVGKDFPVFLHPQTHHEYALARTERKNGRGYTGFKVYAAPEVTLEQDLARRDLTINAIAQTQDGTFIDPYGGAADIIAGIFRHVSPAFTEDPVRILRIARFAARYSAFTVAPETMALMRDMVAAGEVAFLVAERVWQEISRGLLEAAPMRMFEVLDDCGALKVLFPELKALQGVPQPAAHHPEVDSYVHTSMVLAQAVMLTQINRAAKFALPIRFAALVHDLGKALTPAHELPRHRGHEAKSLPLIRQLCERFKVPNDCRDLALLVAAEHGNIHRSDALLADGVLRLLSRCDAIRQSKRFEHMLIVCQADAQGRLGLQGQPYPQAARLLAALEGAKSIDGAQVINALASKAALNSRHGMHNPIDVAAADTSQGDRLADYAKPQALKPTHIAQAIAAARQLAISRVI